MKRKFIPCLLALALSAALAPSALAAAPPSLCYPTSVTRSEDGAQIRKVYELGPEDDPAGIPRSDFEQEGFHYTLTDLLKQEAPEQEQRLHTETVTLNSKSKDMEAVLSLLPAQREFTTGDGLTGTLELRLDTVKVEAAGYGSTTKAVSATRTYPNLSSQDTSYIPKEITDNGRTLELASIDWRTDSTQRGPREAVLQASWGEEEQGSEWSFRRQAETELSGLCDDDVDGYAVADRYTAVVTYTGSATSSYVKGYTVTADYSGSVSRIALNKVRYVAIFEGSPLAPIEPEPSLSPEPEPEPEPEPSPDVQGPAVPAVQFRWSYVLIPLGVVAAIGTGIGMALFIRKHREGDDGDETDGGE